MPAPSGGDPTAAGVAPDRPANAGWARPPGPAGAARRPQCAGPRSDRAPGVRAISPARSRPDRGMTACASILRGSIELPPNGPAVAAGERVVSQALPPTLALLPSCEAARAAGTRESRRRESHATPKNERARTGRVDEGRRSPGGPPRSERAAGPSTARPDGYG